MELGETTTRVHTVAGVTCDTTKTLHLTVHPAYAEHYHRTFCADHGFHLPGIPGHAKYHADTTFKQSGEYTREFKTTTYGCDSTVTWHLTAGASHIDTMVVTTCGPDFTLSFNGNEYKYTRDSRYGSPDGDYYEVRAETNQGCDSIIRLFLVLNAGKPGQSVQGAAETVTSCGPYTWNGKTYSESGTYRDTLQGGSGGCAYDSIVTLHLTIETAPDMIYETITIRESELPYIWSVDGQPYPRRGIYHAMTLTPGGCEQHHELDLRVIPTVYDTIQLEVCPHEIPYKWHGNMLANSGVHRINVSNAQGDTSAYINLIVKPTYHIDVEASFCGDNGYIWNGQTYTDPDPHTMMFRSSQHGCENDSIVTLHLARVDGYSETITHHTCASEYEWRDGGGNVVHTFELSGDRTHTQVFTAAGGCDSTVTMTVVLGDDPAPVTHSEALSICGGSHPFRGAGGADTTLRTSGVYTGRYPAADRGSCRDSIVTLRLTIGQPGSVTIDTTICGDYIEWDGDAYTISGEYQRFYQTAAGCDSTVNLNLTLSQPVHHWFTVYVDHPYEWRRGDGRDTTITTSGDYTYRATDIHGCDSTVTLYITVMENGDVSGIARAEHGRLTLYPNPTTALFSIEATGAREVRVHSISGQLRHRQPLGPDGRAQVDLGHLPAGVYIVRAGSAAAKVVKL